MSDVNKDQLPRVECRYCLSSLRPNSLYKHQQTFQCQVQRRHVQALANGWEMWTYGGFYNPTGRVTRNYPTPTNQEGCKHMRYFESGYVSPGWGKPARSYNSLYVRSSFWAIMQAPQISQEEVTFAATLEETHPQYQALYVLAQLGKLDG